MEHSYQKKNQLKQIEQPINIEEVANQGNDTTRMESVETDRYIILLKESKFKNIEVVAKDILALAGINTETKETFNFINGFVVNLSTEQLERLSEDTRVTSIELDGMTPELPSPAEPQLESQERTKAKIFFSTC